MSKLLARHTTTIVIATVTAALTAGGPALARTFADFARNAGKVDGRHAVGAHATPDERARKLVATNRKGFLPNDVIRKARDSKALGGVNAARYATECDPGTLGGFATVSAAADFPSDWTDIGGHVFIHTIGPFSERCELERVRARRLATGVYEIDVTGSIRICFINDIAVVVTPQGATPAFATHETVCYNDQASGPVDDILAIRVSLWDAGGQAIDAPFDVGILHPVLIGLP